MISREPTLERLAVAKSLLLEPFGLTEATLAHALKTMGSHRIDDADLYFQYTRSEGWSLEEGIVKSGTFGIDQGVGVRAVSRENRVRLFRRHFRSRLARRRAHRANHRRRGAKPQGEGRG
jgi:predicted Zn-dependent protease